ncbi:HTH-type transcriptional regulator BhcR [Cognatiyoonia sp. IB215182]|uniref:HTH-type transcriptional regulator BhcR n=1 Tax=Cognatiyoonia sp. IB215182 TaxID=3097353 RepID=UPI002A0E0F20|nr:HTH-type transcriptional regulator BhcR [Cognatiyoonia sp. IB215182]MDX8351849.1 IclR family transcriptional regulator [Cognatiyoonia sp. IB215182]
MEEDAKRGRGRPKAWDDKAAQNTIKSLDRALEVLVQLGQMQGGTLSEIAGELGQSPATVYRVLSTFKARGFVDFDDETQVWNIGPAAFLTGSQFLRRTSLVERARPIMRDLMEATGETANLGIERDGKVLFLGQVETHATIRAFFPPGTASAMHASGIGKALLSRMDDKRQRAVLAASKLERFTPHTLTEPDAMIADLHSAKARGYAIDGEERNLGMRCIAAPVYNVFGEAVAGISVSGPTSRITEDRIPGLAEFVMKAAATLTTAIGGNGR